MTTKQSLILVQMGSDSRIPASAIGYVDDLNSANLSDSVRADRLTLLARYVPDLVEQYVQSA